MYVFKHLGWHTVKLVNAILLFFIFLGHICHSTKDFLLQRLTISWLNVVKILYYSGARLVMPLAIISALIGMSLSLTTYHIFARLNLQHKALPISQDILTQDILPLLIGFVLCVQASLSVITARIKITIQGHTPEEVVLEYILPIIIGIDITALLLYTYTVIALFISLFFTFHFILNISSAVFLLEIKPTTTLFNLFYSATKTLLYGSIVSLTAGYYYYQVAVSQLSVRKAVSRILTRGSLWLTISSVCWKFMTF